MKIKILQCCVAALRSKRTDPEYINFLIKTIMPLMRLICPELYDRWEKECRDFLQRRKMLEVAALAEMEEVFVVLKKRLIKKALWGNFEDIDYIKSLEAVFRGEPEFVMPIPQRIAYDGLKSLVEDILNLGREDLIQDYVKIDSDPMGKQGAGTYKSAYSFIFAPSFHKLTKHNEILASNLKKNPNCSFWSAIEFLYSLEWAYRISPDFFRPRKKLGYENSEACERSRNLLELNALRADVKAVTGKRQRINRVFFYKREHIDKILTIVLDEIYNICADIPLDEDVKIPYAIELIIEDDTKLRLKVELTPEIVEICHLHTFMDLDPQSNIIYNFISDLLAKPKEVVEIGEAEGANVTKYFRRVGINKELEKLFIINKTANSATLRQKRVTLADEPEARLRKLRNYIGKLETVRWLRDKGKWS